MKLYIIAIFLFWGIIGYSQITQISYTQSSGAGQNEAGVYRSVGVVGQSASNGGYLEANGYSGSIGFLTFDANQAGNTAPVAIAGNDILVEEGTTVNLDGSDSFDPQNDSLYFNWQSLDGISISDPSAEQPSFSISDVLARRKYRFVLTVNDGNLESEPDTVTVTVSDPGWIPEVYTNSSTLYAVVTLNGIAAEECDHVAARVGGECRGVSEVFFFGDQAFAVFNIQSEMSETVTFEVYDYSEDKICPAAIEVTTVQGGDIGSPSDPIPVDGDCVSSAISLIEEAIRFKLAPNPTSGKVQLSASFEQVTRGVLQIYNLHGQLLYSEGFQIQELDKTLDLSLFPTGIYIFVLETGAIRIAKKIEKVGS